MCPIPPKIGLTRNDAAARKGELIMWGKDLIIESPNRASIYIKENIINSNWVIYLYKEFLFDYAKHKWRAGFVVYTFIYWIFVAFVLIINKIFNKKTVANNGS